jgi:hypothetical protein
MGELFKFLSYLLVRIETGQRTEPLITIHHSVIAGSLAEDPAMTDKTILYWSRGVGSLSRDPAGTKE